MTSLAGAAAFKALRDALGGTRAANDFTCQEVPLERLRWALLDAGLTPLDRAVRFRHALRYAELTLAESATRLSLPMPLFGDWPDRAQARRCGLRIGAGRETEALPWGPGWLREVCAHGVDATAMRAESRRWTNRLPPADYWVAEVFDHGRYRGAGQALAVRSALHMPAEQTLLAVMPTGEGKSLVFQALAAAHPTQVVAVVVPTVALALAHADSLDRIAALKPEFDHAYVGGNGSNADIVARIPTGEQGLLFAAPEAFVGRLYRPLLEAASNGRLAAFVIDEAHLVNAWGADFRNEFQLLGALVAELRKAAPANMQPKVVCLSATVTQDALDALEALFAPGASLSLVPAARLRPEIDSWIAPQSDQPAVREERVLEALAHLPRPAILYVTRQEDADGWYERLTGAGYGRVRVLHGGSSTDCRQEVVQAWRRGELDLVVGTSAFGLGIDYPHVRAVVHACIPESLDRYYQEIGRAGRDNGAAIALLVPERGDAAIAKAVAAKRVIGVDKGIERWQAMFAAARRIEGRARFLVDPAVPPGYDPDMRGERHEDWNGRVLSLMVRAGMIAFAGLQYDREKRKALVEVDVLQDGHGERRLWDTLIEARREDVWRASTSALRGMQDMIASSACPSARLARLYELTHGARRWPVTLGCGGCAWCRATLPDGWFAQWPNAPAAPWPAGGLSGRVAALLSDGRCLVEREPGGRSSLAQQRRTREIIDALWADGLRKCIVLGAVPEVIHSALATRPWCVAAGQDRKVLSSNGLPPGPELVWVGDGAHLGEPELLAQPVGAERLYLLPPDSADPARPGRPLADRFQLIPLRYLHEVLHT